jgi:hypothetical protein
MHRQIDTTRAGRHAGDPRPHVSFPLVQTPTPAGAGDLRVTCVCVPMAARVMGVRMSAPPTPHADHDVIAGRRADAPIAIHRSSVIVGVVGGSSESNPTSSHRASFCVKNP